MSAGVLRSRVASVAVAAGVGLLGSGTTVARPGASRPPNTCDPAPQGASPFTSDTNRVGLIDLYFFLARGAPVTFYECISGLPHPLGVRSAAHSDITAFYAAAQWTCGRLTRAFAATATLADGTPVRGTTDLHTVSCAHRFALQVPPSATPGERVSVRVVDRWRLGGIHTRLCTI